GGDLAHRYAEFLGDRRDDQEERGEVEGVEGPPGPGRDIGVPLVLGRLPPPRDRLCRLRRRDRHMPSSHPESTLGSSLNFEFKARGLTCHIDLAQIAAASFGELTGAEAGAFRAAMGPRGVLTG